jgi:hypothetical protein
MQFVAVDGSAGCPENNLLDLLKAATTQDGKE